MNQIPDIAVIIYCKYWGPQFEVKSRVHMYVYSLQIQAHADVHSDVQDQYIAYIYVYAVEMERNKVCV